jgi:hypothetical protein
VFATPGSSPDIGHNLTRAAAERVARNWAALLLNGVLLVVAGFLILSIDWTVRELATFIGALFIFQGVVEAVTTGVDARARRANAVAGLLSIATGIVIPQQPGIGVRALHRQRMDRRAAAIPAAGARPDQPGSGGEPNGERLVRHAGVAAGQRPE